MNKTDLWYSVYRVCREHSETHEQACEHATDAVEKAPAVTE